MLAHGKRVILFLMTTGTYSLIGEYGIHGIFCCGMFVSVTGFTADVIL